MGVNRDTDFSLSFRGSGGQLMLRICALLASFMGMSTLVGWSLGRPFLTSLGVGEIPMAPSTALLFTVYGFTIALRAGASQREAQSPQPVVDSLTDRLGMLIHGVAVLITPVLAVLSYRGIFLSLERLGFAMPKAPFNALPVGHISPIVALCFFFSSLAYLLLVRRTPQNRWRVQIAGVLSALVIVIGLVFFLAYLLEVPLFYNVSLIPPALPTCLALTALGSALLILAVSSDEEAELPLQTVNIFVIGVFFVLTVGILTIGALVYWAEMQSFRAQTERQISAVATLKIHEIQKWRRERMEDAEGLYTNEAFLSLAQRYFGGISRSGADRELRSWLELLQRRSDYKQVFLFDSKGEMRMAVPLDPPPVPQAILRSLPLVIESRQILFLDLYRREYDQNIYLSLLIPILDGIDSKRVLGVVSLQIDPEQYLYPFILHWPTPSETAETLLVRRDGDDVLYLNNLKFAKDSALKLRIPLTREEVPAVMAVRGRVGIVEGLDYRNAPSVADVRPVPDSPWWLAARINTTEILAAGKLNFRAIAAAVIAMILGSAAMMGYVWRRKTLFFYKDRYRSTEILRRTHDLLDEAQRLSKLGGWEFDVATGQFIWTDEAYRIYGVGLDYNPNDMERNISFYPPEDRKAIAAAFERTVQDAEPYELELELVRPDGKRIWVRTAGKAVTENGKTIRVIGNIMDVTERKKEQKELLAAKKSAEDAANSKAQFLDIAAHELRTPIAALSVLLQLAQRQQAKGQVPDAGMLARLRSPVDRMARLVVDLLDVSRLERGLVVLQRERADLVAMIASCLAEFQVQNPKRSFVFDKPARPIEMNVDVTRIHQVLSNLLDNAVKYTPAESLIDVSIALESNYVRVSVKDDGPGISKEQQGKLFAAFSRGKSDATLRASGLGLGLSVCRGIIELHDGRIGVVSEEGHGSTFYFELPRKDEIS